MMVGSGSVRLKVGSGGLICQCCGGRGGRWGMWMRDGAGMAERGSGAGCGGGGGGRPSGRGMVAGILRARRWVSGHGAGGGGGQSRNRLMMILSLSPSPWWGRAAVHCLDGGTTGARSDRPAEVVVPCHCL